MLKTILLLAGLTYLALAAFAYFTADRQIFLPPAASYSARELPVTLVPADGGVRIAVLHLPNPASAFTILYSHGNAEDLGHLAPVLQELHEAGFSVLGYDYRGYGASTGAPPSTEGAYRDLAAVYRYATEDLGIPPSRIVLYGRSVGSGPATDLAAREPVAGLVIESGFTSIFRVVTRVPLLPFDRFPNLKNVRRVRSPVLVIHGTDDEVIPFSHGKQLYEAAAEPKRFLWVGGAGHNDLAWVARDAYWNALREFEALLRDRAAGP
ncbi:MAG TPA: alpha/beta hydrolase [Longimicrobiaceae bacterium]|nr:alpha/beta hydrolase [Longimicrobiaceae bacterium]